MPRKLKTPNTKKSNVNRIPAVMNEKELQDRREESLSKMLKIVELAHKQKLITKESSHGEISYRITVPHENNELYCFVADHDA